MVDQWNFIFVFDRLGHRNMEKLLGASDIARFHLFDLLRESPAVSLKYFNMLSHVGEEGHTHG
jgi:hypothetical protein